MITCRQLAELLIDFLSGDLPPESRDRIEKHLGDCPPCVVYLETYRLTIQLTRKLPCAPLPSACEQKLRAILEAEWQKQAAQRPQA
jgi:anti-sigma factor RsiW